MRPQRDVGIAGYGAYVPRLRVRTADISATWRARGAAAPAVAEKSVPGPDEDVVTMAIEAARTALDRSPVAAGAIGAVWVGTESKPYAVKPSATIVAEALGITPHTVAADMEFACKAGSEAMQAAVAFVGSGMVEAALAIGMDTAQSKPGDALEYTAGCGGAAYLFAAAHWDVRPAGRWTAEEIEARFSEVGVEPMGLIAQLEAHRAAAAAGDKPNQ